MAHGIRSILTPGLASGSVSPNPPESLANPQFIEIMKETTLQGAWLILPNSEPSYPERHMLALRLPTRWYRSGPPGRHSAA